MFLPHQERLAVAEVPLQPFLQVCGAEARHLPFDVPGVRLRQVVVAAVAELPRVLPEPDHFAYRVLTGRQGLHLPEVVVDARDEAFSLRDQPLKFCFGHVDLFLFSRVLVRLKNWLARWPRLHSISRVPFAVAPTPRRAPAPRDRSSAFSRCPSPPRTSSAPRAPL